jgi:hypothetical protein
LTGCTFGHEHGRDPSGSDLAGHIAPLAFGYVNEVLQDAGGPTGHRHEDHVGHKVEWINDQPFTAGGVPQTCDVLVKLHQGTHSKDAFTNNVHEIFYHAACTNGVVVHVRMLTPIGPAGEFTVSCDLATRLVAGLPTPLDSPRGDGDSRRRIPTSDCAQNGSLVEQWSTFNLIVGRNVGFIADFNPYFKIANPSRVFSGDQSVPVARPLDVCRALAGSDGCSSLPAEVTWDHPLSPFRGDVHSVAFNRLSVAGHPDSVWYTDPYGKDATPFERPGAIRQFISGSTASLPQGRIVYLGQRSGNFSAPGVRAPN